MLARTEIALILKLFQHDVAHQTKRIALTVLAISWGTLSIVLLLSFGEGMKRSFHKGSRGMGEGIDLKQEAENACFEREPAKVKESLQRLVDISKRIRARPNFLQSGENLPLSGFSGPRANLPESQQRVGADGRAPLPAENVAYLGRSLFTDNLLAVELGGTLLLVATIGAIVITGRRGERL